MKGLKIEIWNENNKVFMQVLDQDDSLRGKGFIYKATNGLKIESWGYPELCNKSICVRGNDKKFDNGLCSLEFETQHEAFGYVLKVQDAVKRYNMSIIDVLEEKEKEYLRAVIKPFRNRVEWITKEFSDLTKKEYITIWLTRERDSFSLPYFKEGTMYKGMEIGEFYLPEELGL